MLVSVYPPSKRYLSSFDTRYALQRDNFNDFSFQTLYHLYYMQTVSDGGATYIGSVKILRKGQTEADLQLIREEFDFLGPEFCSVGTSLDYYQRLNDIPIEERQTIMNALNDVVAKPDLVAEFSNEEGWGISLFRGVSDWTTFLFDSHILYEGNFGMLPDVKEAFSFSPANANANSDITLDFSAPELPGYRNPFRRARSENNEVLLPDRVIVLVGRNGSGKSTILSRIAHVAFASPQQRERDEIRALGSFTPASIGFMRVITISYSAFDNFTVPNMQEKDLRQITSDIEKGDGRFVYCGLRDIVAEVRHDLENAPTPGEEGVNAEGGGSVDRRATTRLKSVEALAKEFVQLLQRIRKSEKDELLRIALEPLLKDPSFVDLKDEVEELFGPNAERIFLEWSTGHKIALHVVASLVANAKRKSLVLFDEPEMHLHPPLIAALMHSVRLVLGQVNAFCIVATHSPVILQETLTRHVRFVRRSGDGLNVHTPELETFGENVGILTYDTFGLTASSTDYHKALDTLIERCDTLENIETVFTPGLSGQARAYVLSCLAAKEIEK